MTSKLYAQYYFELRTISGSLFGTRSAEQVYCSLKPLEIWRAKRLEMKSNSFKMQRMGHLDSASGYKITEADRTRDTAKSIAVEGAPFYDNCETEGLGRGRYVLSWKFFSPVLYSLIDYTFLIFVFFKS